MTDWKTDWNYNKHFDFPFCAEVIPGTDTSKWVVLEWNPETGEFIEARIGETMSTQDSRKEAEKFIRSAMMITRFIWIEAPEKNPNPRDKKAEWPTLHLYDRRERTYIGKVTPEWTESGYGFMPTLHETKDKFGCEAVGLFSTQFDAQKQVLEWFHSPDRDSTVSLLGKRTLPSPGRPVWRAVTGILQAQIEGEPNNFRWTLKASHDPDFNQGDPITCGKGTTPQKAALACNRAAKEVARGLLDIATLDVPE